MKLADLREWLPWAKKRLQCLGPGEKRDLLLETIAWAEGGKPKVEFLTSTTN